MPTTVAAGEGVAYPPPLVRRPPVYTDHSLVGGCRLGGACNHWSGQVLRLWPTTNSCNRHEHVHPAFDGTEVHFECRGVASRGTDRGPFRPCRGFFLNWYDFFSPARRKLWFSAFDLDRIPPVTSSPAQTALGGGPGLMPAPTRFLRTALVGRSARCCLPVSVGPQPSIRQSSPGNCIPQVLGAQTRWSPLCESPGSGPQQR